MRHGNGKRTVISICNFSKFRGGKCFHCINDGKCVDNACQIQRNGAHRDRQSDRKHTFENGALGADGLTDNSNRFTIILGVAIVQEFCNSQEQHTGSDANRDTCNGISCRNFNAFASVDRIISENDTNDKFADRFCDFTDSGRHHVAVSLEITPHCT